MYDSQIFHAKYTRIGIAIIRPTLAVINEKAMDCSIAIV
jgi:hypothetical protein